MKDVAERHEELLWRRPNKYLGLEAEVVFINSLVNRELLIEHFDVDDLKRCVAILNRYSDVDFGFVDTSLMAIAERMNIHNILTTDRRHFSIREGHLPDTEPKWKGFLHFLTVEKLCTKRKADAYLVSVRKFLSVIVAVVYV